MITFELCMTNNQDHRQQAVLRLLCSCTDRPGHNRDEQPEPPVPVQEAPCGAQQGQDGRRGGQVGMGTNAEHAHAHRWRRQACRRTPASWLSSWLRAGPSSPRPASQPTTLMSRSRSLGWTTSKVGGVSLAATAAVAHAPAPQPLKLHQPSPPLPPFPPTRQASPWCSTGWTTWRRGGT